MTHPVGYTTLNDEERELLPDEVVTNYVKGYITLDDVRAIRCAVIEQVRLRVLDRVDEADRARVVAPLHEAFAILDDEADR